MPDYEIYYFNPEGSLIHTMSAACHTDAAARVVAHAMKPLTSSLLEVWKANALIYRRLRPPAGSLGEPQEAGRAQNVKYRSGESQ